MQGLIEQFSVLLGKQYVLIADHDKVPYLTDWRKRFTGKALAVLLPKTTEEVSAIVKLCASNHFAIIP
jgi:FAD/FMN-containing dehydrogenase